jgi:predicted nucleotide-binding protein
MAQRKKAAQPDPPAGPPSLKVLRSQAEERLDKQVEAGRGLINRAESVADRADYENWRDERTRWRRYTTEALRSLYTTSEPADEFDQTPGIGVISLMERPLSRDLADAVGDVRRQVNTVVSLRERLEFIPAPAETESQLGERPKKAGNDDPQIFVVHGHSDAFKERVIRQLEKAGPHPVTVLHEQPNSGKTLIEKFEEYASRSDFAVVLLTADDVGASQKEPSNLTPRARQNVIFELGYFVGTLGRSHVAVLYEDGVELPSDYKGIVYISLVDETWRYKLLQELRATGLDYDLNEIIS